ncbi:MBL fold metallo-hydrolase [Tumebacillus sp. DT12]|uniref:MBL fold metallo-hydrolase n=1 Tax=Tumebacillus lacus TaxID=2995335 RepID=A0ABT3X1C6_9BACL|nr:MBL fold metallo-hydrolase [Tumebacillus lacus]MCX7569772.1 MBL fold metallo-hydrolase [Tumebacillus lacus]
MTATKGVHGIAIPTPWLVGDVNVYVLQDGETVTLVDTGPQTPEAEAALSAGLAEIGLTVGDIDQILLTHFHVDHSGLVERLVKQCGAKVFAHPGTERLIQKNQAVEAERKTFFLDLYRSFGLSDEDGLLAYEQLADYQDYMGQGHVDVMLAEGDRVPGHEAWEVLYTPGHSMDHLSLYRAEDGVMILGDHVIKHISSNAMIEPPADISQPRPRTLVLYREALRKVAAIDWHIGYTGHGEPVTGHRELIEKRLRDQERRAARIVEMVREGRTTGARLCLAMFPHHRNQLSLIVSETLGHLDWLVEEGVLAVEDDQSGIVQYRVVKEMVTCS